MTSEMPAEHAILGLLLLDDGAGHGYDLARHFADGQPLAEVIRLEPGMLYHHLKKLNRSGWATASIEHQGTRPPRMVYRITDAGRAELHRWLREPVAHTREIRLEFLVKLYFARRLDARLAQRLIAEQLETCRRLEASLAAQLERAQTAAPGSNDPAFSRLVLDLRLRQTRAAIAWLSTIPEHDTSSPSRAHEQPVTTPPAPSDV
jgi:PadR family transcriptional regulator AphA